MHAILDLPRDERRFIAGAAAASVVLHAAVLALGPRFMDEHPLEPPQVLSVVLQAPSSPPEEAAPPAVPPPPPPRPAARPPQRVAAAPVPPPPAAAPPVAAARAETSPTADPGP
jgi:protein TonB